MASMVVIFFPATAATGVTQERVGCPSRWTVHAPQSAIPQPNFVPVNPTTSRKTHRIGMSAGTSTVTSRPLIFSVAMTASPQDGGMKAIARSVAGLNSVLDPTFGLWQRNSLGLRRPSTGTRPLIEFQSCGGSKDESRVQYRSTGRREVLGAVVAGIIFRRPQAVPIGGRFDTISVDRDQRLTDAADSGLGQQLLNDPFRPLVFALAELRMSNTPPRIDLVEGRPVVIVEPTPYRIVVIDRDW